MSEYVPDFQSPNYLNKRAWWGTETFLLPVSVLPYLDPLPREAQMISRHLSVLAAGTNRYELKERSKGS